MPLKVTIAAGKGKPPLEVSLASKDATLKDLKEAVAKAKRMHPTRQSYK